jgi:hypothetical protein
LIPHAAAAERNPWEAVTPPGMRFRDDDMVKRLEGVGVKETRKERGASRALLQKA